MNGIADHSTGVGKNSGKDFEQRENCVSDNADHGYPDGGCLKLLGWNGCALGTLGAGMIFHNSYLQMAYKITLWHLLSAGAYNNTHGTSNRNLLSRG